jgi:Uma2 family endonuclease
MALQATTKLTYDDYALIPDDGLKHEIIDGEHYVNPAPNVRHQRVSRRILKALVIFVDDRDLGEVFYSPIDVVFSKHNVVQPDILFVRKANAGELQGANVKIAPDLVVEVLSISNRKHDEVRKLELYDTFNVSEYWIADPEQDLVKVFRRQNGSLTLVENVDIDGTITTPLLPGFALAVHAVFT